MDQLFALGVSCIEFIQYWFQDSEDYFIVVNELANPNNVMNILFPLISVLDSVFAAQLLLCMAFGGWLSVIIKWWLLEDRPYWWIKETSFYNSNSRPHILQYPQTCETGPGNPSGHSLVTAMTLMLAIMWLSHIMNDRKCYVWWWKYIAYPLCFSFLFSVMLARVYIGAHFPHQCVIGAIIGSFLSPALCIYVSDPYIWKYGVNMNTTRSRLWHIFSASVTVAISAATYFSLKIFGWDPMWTVKMAFRWCENPDNIHVATTPMFALVQFTGALFGWAIFVTPAVSEYRHYTKQRSLVISAFVTGMLLYAIHKIEHNIDTNSVFKYYASHLVIAVLKPALFLCLTPFLAMWPFSRDKTKLE